MSDIGPTHRMPRDHKMNKYVEIRPVVIQGQPDAHHVFLRVTNQSFCVSPHGCETKDEAEWMRDMLCVALAKIVADAAFIVKAVNNFEAMDKLLAQAADELNVSPRMRAMDLGNKITQFRLALQAASTPDLHGKGG